MKVRVYVAAGLLVGTIATSATAFAATELLTCSISGTGPDSNNTCLQFIGEKCKVQNNTTIIVTNNNDQESESGDADVDDNTNGGGASSGNAGNSNSSNVNAVIDNMGACVAAAVPAAPTTPTAPAPEQPRVESAQTTKPQVKAPVGGVAAGVGSTDTTGLLVALLVAGMAAVGFGFRRIADQK